MAHSPPPAAPAPGAPGPSRQPGTIRPIELEERLRAGEAIQLVDVREEGELEMARLPHAVLHLPLSRSAEWLTTVTERLDRERPVAVRTPGRLSPVASGTPSTTPNRWCESQRPGGS